MKGALKRPLTKSEIDNRIGAEMTTIAEDKARIRTPDHGHIVFVFCVLYHPVDMPLHLLGPLPPVITPTQPS